MIPSLAPLKQEGANFVLFLHGQHSISEACAEGRRHGRHRHGEDAQETVSIPARHCCVDGTVDTVDGLGMVLAMGIEDVMEKETR